MIDLSSLPQQPIGVLGLGRSGCATVTALVAAGFEVWAWDDNREARTTAIEQLPASVSFEDPVKWALDRAYGLVLSPGIPLYFPAPHPVVEQANRDDCPVIGDVELFCRAMPNAHIIGITGTNGKSTSTALIAHILATADRPHQMGGNIGTPVLALDPLGPDGLYVLELSSFQLDLTPSLDCFVAILLNVSSDHLDRHGGLEGYIGAKRRIFARQSPRATAVIGIDDPLARSIADDMAARTNGSQVLTISGRTNVEVGAFVQGAVLFDAVDPSGPVAVLDLDTAAALPGDHNAQNAAAAFAAVRAAGVPREIAAQAIASFPGLAHRQEIVGTLNGVTFVNDSKATNPEAAARALACYEHIYWIAGGRPKEAGLEAVAPYLDRVRHAFLIGEAEDRFAGWLHGRVPITRAHTLEKAVTGARTAAISQTPAGLDPQAVVLLSPACASFDQFRNFEARGDAFRQLVQRLAVQNDASQEGGP